jgi:3-phosphoshikimate 1-carboxyvinyltransferase
MRMRPARRIRGRLSLPGDKSISHRAAMIAAVADGPSRLANFSSSTDCASTLLCLRGLGVAIDQAGNNVVIHGAGARGLTVPDEPLDCGNSGSTMRMLAGILAGQSFASTLTGDQSLRTRPMRRIIEPLVQMGARVISENGRPPLRIEGRNPLMPIRYELPVASAQVKSCVLFAGLHARGRTEVTEKLGVTRDHTERMLNWFGVPVETRDTNRDGSATRVIAVNGQPRFSGREVSIPGDLSAAAFLIAAAALLPDSELEIEAVGLNPTRTQFLTTLRTIGLDVDISDVGDDCNEPVGMVRARGQATHQPHVARPSHLLRGALIPQLIDELPLLAVLGTQVSGGLEIRDAAELRVKETDRIAATVNNLRAMGAAVEEYDDGLAVAGPTCLRGGLIDSRGDHRIAMAFTIAALLAAGDSEIAGAECVAVSFPEFFGVLESVVER